MRFIVFERTAGHCHVTLLRGDTLTHALGAYLAREWKSDIDHRGWIVDDDVPIHPLELIEREYKAHPQFDELEVDQESFATLNEDSFEVRVLPDGALDVNVASVLTSAEPGYSAGEIVKARVAFARDYPNAADARAFFWYVRGGVIVTFFTLDNGDEGRKMTVIARYLTNGSDPWAVEKWDGSYEALAEQMTFERPF